MLQATRGAIDFRARYGEPTSDSNGCCMWLRPPVTVGGKDGNKEGQRSVLWRASRRHVVVRSRRCLVQSKEQGGIVRWSRVSNSDEQVC